MANIDERQNQSLNSNENSRRIKEQEPETLTNTIYTPAFLREQIGKLMRVEFLVGTYMLTDRIGVLEEVGASYIILRSFESDSIMYCDMYSIKFITMPASRVL